MADEPLSELTCRIYKMVMGWESHNGLEGERYTARELLELVDRVRIPLAEKVFDGEELSPKEQSYLAIVEQLTDVLLESLSPRPKETQEVQSALQYARQLIRDK